MSFKEVYGTIWLLIIYYDFIKDPKSAPAGTVREGVERIPGVLLAYSKSIDRVLYLATGTAGGALFAPFGMRWTNIKKKTLGEKIETSSATRSPTPECRHGHFPFPSLDLSSRCSNLSWALNPEPWALSPEQADKSTGWCLGDPLLAPSRIGYSFYII
jgi:hypothetical protein